MKKVKIKVFAFFILITWVVQKFYDSQKNYTTQVNKKDLEDEYIKALIKETYDRIKGIYGYRCIQIDILQKHKINNIKEWIYRLMKEMGLKSEIRRKLQCYNSETSNIAKSRRYLW